MNFFDFLQLLGGVILSAGYIPQIVQLIRTRSCGDLNFNTYLSLFFGISLMEIYALNLWIKNGTGRMFFITNTASLLLVLTVCVLILFINEKKCKEILEPKEAFFVSTWDDDSVVVTPCRVDPATKHIMDIVICPCSVSRGMPENEYLVYNDCTYPVCPEDRKTDNDTFWY